MNITTEMRYKTRICDAATGKILTERPWEKNLVLDKGLNSLAQLATGVGKCFPATMATYAQAGGGTNPNSFASGAVTFTQATTVLTASGGFFTSAMVGGIFKWGTGSGGVEVYITAFTSTTVVSVAVSATVSTPAVGTVWMVQQTALQTPLFATNTYQTNSGDCQTTFPSSSTVSLKRTYTIAQQGSPYTVNEIGYSPISGTTHVCGRAVLSSSDVVGTSNFYVIVIELIFTYSPAAPTAVSNVGTNINTAGNATIEIYAIRNVATNGGTSVPSGQTFCGLDASGNSSGNNADCSAGFPTATYSQNSTPLTSGSGLNPGGMLTLSGSVNWVNNASVVGQMQLTITGSVTTAAQTLYGIGLLNVNLGQIVFDVKFTTPQTAPTGTFTPNPVFSMTYGRTLTN